MIDEPEMVSTLRCGSSLPGLRGGALAPGFLQDRPWFWTYETLKQWNSFGALASGVGPRSPSARPGSIISSNYPQTRGVARQKDKWYHCSKPYSHRIVHACGPSPMLSRSLGVSPYHPWVLPGFFAWPLPIRRDSIQRESPRFCPPNRPSHCPGRNSRLRTTPPVFIMARKRQRSRRHTAPLCRPPPLCRFADTPSPRRRYQYSCLSRLLMSRP